MTSASSALPDTMRAITSHTYGTSANLQLEQIPVPTLQPDSVLVQVAACGLNAADKHVLRGKPYLIRAMYGFTKPKQPIVCRDFAGTVVAVGEGCTRLHIGDRVFGEAGAGLAEYACVREAAMQLIPAALGFSQAAALPISGTTALRALDVAGVRAGDRILIHGASGGVGTMAVQIARARGAHVIATCSAGNAATVRSLGADEVIDYQSADPLQGEVAYDAIVDCVGDLRLRAVARRLQPGRLGVKVGFGGGPWIGPLVPFIAAPLASIGAPGKVHILTAGTTLEALATIANMTARGEIQPRIEREYDFGDFRTAFARLESGRTVGKSVIRIVSGA